MMSLIRNELFKIRRRRCWWILSCIILVYLLLLYIPSFLYTQLIKPPGVSFSQQNWKAEVQKDILNIERKAQYLDPGDSDLHNKARLVIQKAQDAVARDVNPYALNAFKFVNQFINLGCQYLFPFLIIFLMMDLVSGEYERGAISNLITSPQGRLRIVVSKICVSVLAVSMLLMVSACLVFVVAGILFGYGGWNEEAFLGSMLKGGFSAPERFPFSSQILTTMMNVGLAWFSSLSMVIFGFLISILLRNSVLSACISSLLFVVCPVVIRPLITSWGGLSYFPFLHFALPEHLWKSGSFFPKDMLISFSLSILSIWVLVSIFVIVVTFIRRDVYRL